jgi:hypothetical protein
MYFYTRYMLQMKTERKTDHLPVVLFELAHARPPSLTLISRRPFLRRPTSNPASRTFPLEKSESDVEITRPTPGKVT